MSNIDVKLNLDTGQWAVNKTDYIAPDYVDLRIGFIRQVLPVMFESLSFGFELFYKNFEQVLLESWPKGPMRYISTDQEYIESIRLSLLDDRIYKLRFWAFENNQRYDHIFEFESGLLYPDYPTYEVS
jgi:hypothetical protein